MGTLWSTTDEPIGYIINNVVLGYPVELDGDPNTFEWDDALLPNGEVRIVDGVALIIPAVEQ